VAEKKNQRLKKWPENFICNRNTSCSREHRGYWQW
jgi:hypothetical protein